jgi:hypothetical protein
VSPPARVPPIGPFAPEPLRSASSAFDHPLRASFEARPIAEEGLASAPLAGDSLAGRELASRATDRRGFGDIYPFRPLARD